MANAEFVQIDRILDPIEHLVDFGSDGSKPALVLAIVQTDIAMPGYDWNVRHQLAPRFRASANMMTARRDAADIGLVFTSSSVSVTSSLVSDSKIRAACTLADAGALSSAAIREFGYVVCPVH
jgi:hypothetical protein